MGIYYKVFHVNKVGELFPAVTLEWESYSRKHINTRADGFGPFAAFSSLKRAKYFSSYNDVKLPAKVFKVRGKKSKLTKLFMPEEFKNDFPPDRSGYWDDLFRGKIIRRVTLPNKTVLLDEFEILEEMK